MFPRIFSQSKSEGSELTVCFADHQPRDANLLLETDVPSRDTFRDFRAWRNSHARERLSSLELRILTLTFINRRAGSPHLRPCSAAEIVILRTRVKCARAVPCKFLRGGLCCIPSFRARRRINNGNATLRGSVRLVCITGHIGGPLHSLQLMYTERITCFAKSSLRLSRDVPPIRARVRKRSIVSVRFSNYAITQQIKK